MSNFEQTITVNVCSLVSTGGLRCPDLNQRHPAFISSWVALCCRAKYGRLSAGKVGEGQQIGL